MDCSSEETLIRLKLQSFPAVRSLQFDLQNRQLVVFHTGELEGIKQAITDLNLGGKLVSSLETEAVPFEENENQKKLLWTVLVINFAFFVVEFSSGFFFQSMGLVADSLDMLADAFVYGLGLFAVGALVARKKKVAKIAGVFQIVLALVGLLEVVRRFVGIEKMPDFLPMIIVSMLALIANGFCLFLLQKSKSKDAHMQASMIFTSNDVIINLGVILAGGLVFWTNSYLPDLIVGIIVFSIVLFGAKRILSLAK